MRYDVPIRAEGQGESSVGYRMLQRNYSSKHKVTIRILGREYLANFWMPQ
jgi:hypothetical protein